MMALPMMMIPPQSPGLRLGALRCEVKTIGCAAVPLAMIFAPRKIHSELPPTVESPTILVPGWIVSVAPLRTLTKPERTYRVSLYNVRLAAMSADKVTMPIEKLTTVENALVSEPAIAATRYWYTVLAA